MTQKKLKINEQQVLSAYRQKKALSCLAYTLENTILLGRLGIVLIAYLSIPVTLIVTLTHSHGVLVGLLDSAASIAVFLGFYLASYLPLAPYARLADTMLRRLLIQHR